MDRIRCDPGVLDVAADSLEFRRAVFLQLMTGIGVYCAEVLMMVYIHFVCMYCFSVLTPSHDNALASSCHGVFQRKYGVYSVYSVPPGYIRACDYGLRLPVLVSPGSIRCITAGFLVPSEVIQYV